MTAGTVVCTILLRKISHDTINHPSDALKQWRCTVLLVRRKIRKPKAYLYVHQSCLLAGGFGRHTRCIRKDWIGNWIILEIYQPNGGSVSRGAEGYSFGVKLDLSEQRTNSIIAKKLPLNLWDTSWTYWVVRSAMHLRRLSWYSFIVVRIEKSTPFWLTTLKPGSQRRDCVRNELQKRLRERRQSCRRKGCALVGPEETSSNGGKKRNVVYHGNLREASPLTTTDMDCCCIYRVPTTWLKRCFLRWIQARWLPFKKLNWTVLHFPIRGGRIASIGEIVDKEELLEVIKEVHYIEQIALNRSRGSKCHKVQVSNIRRHTKDKRRWWKSVAVTQRIPCA